jgi:hypothetical protein
MNGDPWWRDELGSRLEALADRLENDYAGLCQVDRRTWEEHGIRSVWVTPTNTSASPTGWDDLGGALQVYAGSGNGGRWELDRSAEDAAFLEEVVLGVAEGRVSEVFGPGRSRVEVVMTNGETAVETGAMAPAGCLPVPGWVRRGRRVQYQSYRP